MYVTTRHLLIVSAAFVSLWVGAVRGETVTIHNRQFTIPAGFHLEIAVEPGLTDRPIVVDFDEQGNLYVAESSGTNDDVQKQLNDRPHSILRLSDSNHDGVFDRRTIFADRMMFPEGTLWHEGSLYVAAPPQIWKLTDHNGDGVADQREIWFDAKTLTGCANDLHGPYLGPDGWIYWCKGAFAEQTYSRPGHDPFVTRAAHIFRRRPEGGPIEPVMTGGMDNPVEVAFSPSGERFFTTTFFQHPAHGRRDGLIHAIYGGVYGKQHGVIDGHPRTGDLMPVMTHLGAAAPSGLARLDSNSLGLRNQLVSACFNLHSVQLHELKPVGSTFSTIDSSLVSSDDLDFHPTDIVEDADGSLLIVDTGGWYKLCCPTSQLHKPDVLGTIYRLRKKQMPTVDDARGRMLAWDNVSTDELVGHLADPRFAVQRRAVQRLATIGPASVPALVTTYNRATNYQVRLAAVWAACRIHSDAARGLIRRALRDPAPSIRTAAAHAASVWRDQQSVSELLPLLTDSTLSCRRAAAEALGRVGDSSAVEHLFGVLETDTDRVLQHSLTYALLEIGAADATRAYLSSDAAPTVLAALRALHGMPDGQLSQDEICRFLSSDDHEISEIASSIAATRPEWGESYADTLRQHVNHPGVAKQISKLVNSEPIRQLVLDWLSDESIDVPLKLELLEHLDATDFDANELGTVLGRLLSSEDQRIASATVRKLAENDAQRTKHRTALETIARSPNANVDTRLVAISCLDQVDDDLLDFARSQLVQSDSVQHRSLASTAIADLQLTSKQLLTIADSLRAVGPLELGRTLMVFDAQTDQELGRLLLTSLVENPVATSLPVDLVAKLAQQFGPAVAVLAEPLLQQANVTPAAKAKHLDALLVEIPAGDLRRGQLVFHGEKAACFACHAVGYRGGTIGPDLSRIASVRSRRDLLEAIVYPSASFVRSYEPISIVTTDGKQFTGTIRNQTDRQIELQLNATETQSVATADIESMVPSQVSIMPAGLEQQLSLQDLADLLVFLESRK